MADNCRIVFGVDPEAAFGKIKTTLRNKALRQAVSKGSGVVRNHMQTIVPVRSGALAKSLKIRTRAYKGKNLWCGIIGPNWP